MKVIRLNGDINPYNRWYLENELRAAEGKPVTLIINSLGGRVDCAIAMRQMIQAHGDVTAEITGFVASAATFLALGAKTVKMHSTSMWLAHKCSLVTDVYGALNADDLAAVIAKLEGQKKMQEAVDANIAGIYFSCAQKKGKSMKDVCDMMTEATWMSADQCREWGFVDDIINDHGRIAVDEGIKNLLNSYSLPVPAIENQEPDPIPDDEEPKWLAKLFDFASKLLPKEQNTEQILDEVRNELDKSKALVKNLQEEQKKFVQFKAAIDGLGATVAQAETAEEKVAAIRNLIAEATTPALSPVNLSEEMDLSDVAKDPVNNYSNN